MASLFLKYGHFAFIDCAYLGFASGSPYTDAESIRIFAECGVNMLLAATYGKCCGLYGERVGNLSIVAPSKDVAGRIELEMKLLARAETGGQPTFGALIVETILTNETLRKMWEEDVRHMANELRNRRELLRIKLENFTSPGRWDFLTSQRVMFS